MIFNLEVSNGKNLGGNTNIIYIRFSTIFTLVLAQTPIFNRLSGMALARAGVYTQVILFILAAILIIFLHFKIKNPTNLEQEHKESKRYIIPWAVLGFS